VFLGYGNGIFKAQKEIFTGPNFRPMSIAIGDLNGDTQLDIVFPYMEKSVVSMMVGYGNGTLNAKKNYLIRANSSLGFSLAFGDFNEGDFLDVIVGGMDSYAVNMLLGRGDGTFHAQTIFSTEARNLGGFPIIINDFNNDVH
jgi:hypothetical protein